MERENKSAGSAFLPFLRRKGWGGKAAKELADHAEELVQKEAQDCAGPLRRTVDDIATELRALVRERLASALPPISKVSLDMIVRTAIGQLYAAINNATREPEELPILAGKPLDKFFHMRPEDRREEEEKYDRALDSAARRVVKKGDTFS